MALANAISSSQYDARPATVKVFTTVELLEIILLALPNQDLLMAQYTCTTWRDVVRASKDIKIKLFLLPSSDRVRTHRGIQVGTSIRLSQLMNLRQRTLGVRARSLDNKP